MIITILRQEYLGLVQAYLESTKREREEPLCVSYQCCATRLVQLFRWLTNDGKRRAQITHCGVHEKLLKEIYKELRVQPQLYVDLIEVDHRVTAGQLILCIAAKIIAQLLRTQREFIRVGSTIVQCTNEVCRSGNILLSRLKTGSKSLFIGVANCKNVCC